MVYSKLLVLGTALLAGCGSSSTAPEALGRCSLISREDAQCTFGVVRLLETNNCASVGNRNTYAVEFVRSNGAPITVDGGRCLNGDELQAAIEFYQGIHNGTCTIEDLGPCPPRITTSFSIFVPASTTGSGPVD